jgi:hypothetical protein
VLCSKGVHVSVDVISFNMHFCHKNEPYDGHGRNSSGTDSVIYDIHMYFATELFVESSRVSDCDSFRLMRI